MTSAAAAIAAKYRDGVVGGLQLSIFEDPASTTTEETGDDPGA